MPSPFPGMDPYLEDRHSWRGFHAALIVYIRDAIQPRVRPAYRAVIEERDYVTADDRSIYPDLTISHRMLRETAPILAPSVAEVASEPHSRPADNRPPTADQPLRIRVPLSEHREGYLEIIHRDSGDVVTVIEILSPTNKVKGEGRRQYRRKQRQILHSEASLVEIDLLSYGHHTVALPANHLTDLPPHRYRVCVCRVENRETFEVYTFGLADRLPRVAIPLLAPDPDVVLDLPAVFTQCYDNGGYADDIDYTRPPPAALSEEEAAWLRELQEARQAVAAVE